MTYNPFQDFNPMFTTYKYYEPEVTTYDDPLFGKLNTPEGFTWSRSGNLVPRTEEKKEEKLFDSSYLDNMAATHFESTIPSDNLNFEGGALIDNERFAYDYLIKKGLPKGAAAGIVGNLYHEGLANPTKSNKDSHGTTSYGIAQFNSNGEFPTLMNWAKKKGIKGNPNFTQQLDFIVDIINERKGLNILLNDKITPTEASFIWGSQFERFAGDNKKNGYKDRNDSHHRKRASRANKIFKSYG